MMICTKAFTLKEFVKTAKEISILWRDSEGNDKDPRWLAGLITFGTGDFRHIFAETLRTVRIDTRPGKIKQISLQLKLTSLKLLYVL